MNTSRTTLIIGLSAIAIVGVQLTFMSNGVSDTLKLMQFGFLGLGIIAVVGALVRMVKDR